MCITLDGGSSPSVLPIDYFHFTFGFLSRFVKIGRVLLEILISIYFNCLY